MIAYVCSDHRDRTTASDRYHRDVRRLVKNFWMSMPIYVTRPTATGLIATYNLSIGLSLLVMLLALLNAYVWGVYGLYYFVTSVLF